MTSIASESGDVHVVEELAGEQLLLPDAGALHDEVVVVRAVATDRTKLARAMQDASGAGRRVSRALAHGLGEQRAYFPIAWRRATRLDLVRYGDPRALAGIVLTLLAAVGTAVVTAVGNWSTIGWPLAVLLLIVVIAAVLLTTRREAGKLVP